MISESPKNQNSSKKYPWWIFFILNIQPFENFKISTCSQSKSNQKEPNEIAIHQTNLLYKLKGNGNLPKRFG
jgi:hypothetical protein